MPKSKDRRDEIAEVVEELREAMVSFLEISETEDKAKLAKTKAQLRLAMARDAVRSLTVTLY